MSRAMELVREAVAAHARWREPLPANVVSLPVFRTLGQVFDEMIAAPVGERELRGALRRWLQAAHSLQRGGMDECTAWYRVGKPWLATLVGWHATSELGRAAGAEAYALLAETWNAHWDEASSEAHP